MSLTTCLKKAGAALHDEDRARILEAAAAHRAAGLKSSEASLKAVSDAAAYLRGLIEAHQQAPSEAAPKVEAAAAPKPEVKPEAPAAPNPEEVVAQAQEIPKAETPAAPPEQPSLQSIVPRSEGFSAAGYERTRVPNLQASRKLARYVKDLDEGKITEAQFALQVKVLQRQMEQNVYRKDVNRVTAERQRGADIVREKLIAARRRGELDPETVDFALWALDKNPALANDLGISLVTPKEGGVAGDYNPTARIMRVLKGHDNLETAVHEILHHAERMMPPEMQDAIRGEWAAAVSRAMKTATPEQAALLREYMPKVIAGSQRAHNDIVKAIQDGKLSYDHYQLINPSEFWAVNASRILNNRFLARDSIWGRIRQWLGEMVQKVRGLIGMGSDAPVIKALNEVINPERTSGDRLSPKMLSDARAMREQTFASPTERRAPEKFGSEDEAKRQGYTVKAYRGIDRDSPFNETGTTWLTTSRDVAESYASEVMGYENPGVLTVMVRPDGLPRVDASRLTDEQRASMGEDELGNPQAPGIYDRSDDHPLGGSAGDVTVIHAPKDATFVVNDENAKGVRFADVQKSDKERLADALRAGRGSAEPGTRPRVPGYSAYEGVEQTPRAPGASVASSISNAMAPTGREGATATAGIIRANLGEQARERELAQERTIEFAKRFDRMPVEDNYDFISRMERGQKQATPELTAAATALRTLLNQRRDQVIALGTGALENFNENYFPHIWKDKIAASNFFSRRPLEGGKGFLKQRTYDYFSEGIDAGLTPITTNPVELAWIKAREMDRYIYAQRIFGEMKDAGIAKFVAYGNKHPDGWIPIDDRIAKVHEYAVLASDIKDQQKAEQQQPALSEELSGGGLQPKRVPGQYYAPEPAATLLNNHLSPGLAGIPAYDMVRRIGNVMNTAQLGLSAFHLGFTTLDAVISKTALGVQQISRGDIGKGLLSLAETPVAWATTFSRGDKLMRAYLSDAVDPRMKPIVEALQQAGGRVRMDPFYRNTAANEFRQAVRTGQYGSAAMKALPALMDTINKPIFEYLVPRQKLGVFFDMAKDALDKNPNMTLAEKRETFGKLWDSVDNRMGQMVYDNVFWNRALKDALMVSVRSVGWNYGTWREIGGGVKDIKDIGKIGGLSARTSYVFGLAFVTSIIGSTLNYMMTGEGPKELKDVFFPRTGRTRPDGTEDRLSLPSYIKDIYEYGHDLVNFGKYGDNPFNTVLNKLHPLISTMAQVIENKDFFGGAIRSPGDSTGIGMLMHFQLPDKAEDWRQELDMADYALKQVTPFSVRNYRQQAQTREEEPTLGGYLTSPSMIGVTPSPGYITKTPEEAESAQVNRMRGALVTKFRNEMRDGADWPDIRERALDAGLSQQDLNYIRGSAVQKPPKRLKSFAEH